MSKLIKAVIVAATFTTMGWLNPAVAGCTYTHTEQYGCKWCGVDIYLEYYTVDKVCAYCDNGSSCSYYYTWYDCGSC